ALVPQRAEELEAVQLREHHVDDQEVELTLARLDEALLAVLRDEDAVALGAEVHLEAHRDAVVVLDHEDGAAATVRGAVARRDGPSVRFAFSGHAELASHTPSRRRSPVGAHVPAGAGSCSASGRAGPAIRGRTSVNALPRPGALSTSTLPRCARMT